MPTPAARAHELSSAASAGSCPVCASDDAAGRSRRLSLRLPARAAMLSATLRRRHRAAARPALREDDRAPRSRPLRRRNFETVLDRLARLRPRPGARCSRSAARTAGSWTRRRGAAIASQGIEPDARDRRQTRCARPCGDHADSSPRRSTADAHYDAIVFNDVLEHLPDPAGALHACRERLAPGGLARDQPAEQPRRALSASRRAADRVGWRGAARSHVAGGLSFAASVVLLAPTRSRAWRGPQGWSESTGCAAVGVARTVCGSACATTRVQVRLRRSVDWSALTLAAAAAARAACPTSCCTSSAATTAAFSAGATRPACRCVGGRRHDRDAVARIATPRACPRSRNAAMRCSSGNRRSRARRRASDSSGARSRARRSAVRAWLRIAKVGQVVPVAAARIADVAGWARVVRGRTPTRASGRCCVETSRRRCAAARSARRTRGARRASSVQRRHNVALYQLAVYMKRRLSATSDERDGRAARARRAGPAGSPSVQPPAAAATSSAGSR